MARDPEQHKFSLKFFPLNNQAFISSNTCAKLNAAQRYFYLQILCNAWHNGGRINPDVSTLKRLTQAKYNRDIEPIMANLIPHPRCPGWLTQKRLYGELVRVLKQFKIDEVEFFANQPALPAKRKTSGGSAVRMMKLRARRRAQKPTGDARKTVGDEVTSPGASVTSHLSMKSTTLAPVNKKTNISVDVCSSPVIQQDETTASHLPDRLEVGDASRSAPRSPTARSMIDADWSVRGAQVSIAQAAGIESMVVIERIGREFKSYWLASREKKANWLSTWRNWCVREAGKLRGNAALRDKRSAPNLRIL